MSTSLIKPDSLALARLTPVTLAGSVDDDDRGDDDRDCPDDEKLGSDAWKKVRDAPLGDEVIGLREWGTRRVLPLRAPRDSMRAAATNTAALELSPGTLATAANGVELTYEGQSWHVKDWQGIAVLKQDGRPTREISLMSGTEVSIAGRTLIAESPRSIALRDFCARLLGWSDDRVVAVDQALRAIRLASSGRVALVLRGCGDLVPVAHAIHRHTLGHEAPFVVSDRRRKGTSATVRSPANCPCGVDAFRGAFRGTLCIRARRLPQDFEAILAAFREPESGVRLTVCANGSMKPARNAFALGAAQIDIPSLETRRSELYRIASEYVEDAIDALQAPDDCLGSSGLDWIVSRSAPVGDITIHDIEKAAYRMVALRTTHDLSEAAQLLGMARVSLERWFARRNNDSP